MTGRISVPNTFLAGFVVLFFSCNHAALTKSELLKYVDDSKDLSQVKQVGDIKVQVKYYPWQLLVQQELGTSKGQNTDTAKLRELEKKYRAQYYFRISFSKNNKEVIRELGSFSRYSDMLQVFSFEMGSHVNATTEKNDTAYIKDYAFEQSYGMTNASSILAAFDQNALKDTRDIKLNIGEFGLGTGAIEFRFPVRSIEAVPELKYTEQ